MAGETETPNIGLQVPAFNQPNWQVPLVYDLNLLDKIFGGETEVPGLWVDTLKVTNFVITNLVASLAASFVMEIPDGVFPGTVYQTTFVPGLIIGVYYNGLLLNPQANPLANGGAGAPPDYTVSGNQITTSFSTASDGVLYVLYFH